MKTEHPQANSCMPLSTASNSMKPLIWCLSQLIIFAHSRNLYKCITEYGHNFLSNFFHLAQYLWISFITHISCLVLMLDRLLFYEYATVYLVLWWVIITFNNYRNDSDTGHIHLSSWETLPQKVDTHFFIS